MREATGDERKHNSLQSSAMLLSYFLLLLPKKKKEEQSTGRVEQANGEHGHPAERIKNLLYSELTKMVVPKGVALTWCNICDPTRLPQQALLKLGASHLYVFSLKFPYIQGDEFMHIINT